MTEPKTELHWCNQCASRTAHRLVTATSDDKHDREWSLSIIHQILICVTCGTGVYRRRSWFSEHQGSDPESDPVYDDEYFPPSGKRIRPKWHDQLPEKLGAVLSEVYIALQYDLRFIAAVGCRTALDIAVVEKVGDLGCFGQKIKALLKERHISPEEKELLLTISDSGDAAAHRGFCLEVSDLIAVIEVLERFLHSFYIKPLEEQKLRDSAKTVRAKVPPRKPNKR